MILFWHPLIISLIAVMMTILGFKWRKKYIVIYALLLPAFTGTPIMTATRGAAGAIVASDVVGIALFGLLFFIPREWLRSYKLKLHSYVNMIMMFLVISICFMGLFYNFISIDYSQQGNVRLTSAIPLPILMAGFRMFKLIAFASYIYFFLAVRLDERDAITIINAIITGCILLALAMILTRLSVVNLSLAHADIRQVHIGPRILGLTKSSVGRLMCVGFVLSLLRIYQGGKLFNLLGIIVTVGALSLSGSRGSLLALVVALMVIYVLGKSRGILLGTMGAVVIGIVGIVFLNYNQDILQAWMKTVDAETISTASSRTIIWKETVFYWMSNPLAFLVGVGLFNFSYANTESYYESAHNDLLTAITEIGICGGLFYILILFSLAWFFYRQTIHTSGNLRWHYVCILALLLGLTVSSIFEPTFYLTVSNLTFNRIVTVLFLIQVITPVGEINSTEEIEIENCSYA
ncbi:O-antigen ligase family protein [Poriferisphaera sp. WC338]|uniref:O-antigen ligase family protein n=1 Tax=Poriferisphaera sp. WC338 TaxID=3425129 RepID=UPI003D812B41